MLLASRAVVVVTPQIGLMMNQLQFLLSLGISVINISCVAPQITAAKETNCVTSQT